MVPTPEKLKEYGFTKVNNSTWRRDNITLQNAHDNEGKTLWEKILNTKRCFKMCVNKKYFKTIRCEYDLRFALDLIKMMSDITDYLPKEDIEEFDRSAKAIDIAAAVCKGVAHAIIARNIEVNYPELLLFEKKKIHQDKMREVEKRLEEERKIKLQIIFFKSIIK